MRRTYSLIAVVLLSAAIFAAVGALIWRSLSAERTATEIAHARARVERYISLERWNDAADAIRAVAGSVPDDRNWLLFLRQARLVEQGAGFDEFTLEMARQAWNRFSDSERLTAVLALLQLEAGRVEEAASYAQGLPVGLYESIVAEARLRSGEGRVPEGESAAAKVASAVSDPSPQTLEAAWEASGRPAFAHNAALELLGRSERQEAARLVAELPAEMPYAELAFFLAVEQEAAEEADEYLHAIPSDRQAAPEILLARADLAEIDGNREQRRLLLEDVVAGAPEYSPVVYLALAELSESLEERIAYLETGHTLFPSSARTALELSRAYRQDGRDGRALDVVSNAMENANEPEIRLSLAHIELDEELSRERKRTKKWELLEAFPQSEEIAGHLAAESVRSGDIQGLSLLLAHGGTQQAVWRNSVEAAVLFARNETDAGMELLETTERRSWREEFHYGLLLLHEERFGTAADAFAAAAEAAKRAGASDEEIASVYLRSAEAALVRGRSDQARSFAFQALELDPASARGRMLMRTLGEEL